MALGVRGSCRGVSCWGGVEVMLRGGVHRGCLLKQIRKC